MYKGSHRHDGLGSVSLDLLLVLILAHLFEKIADRSSLCYDLLVIAITWKLTQF